jgi:polyhydroxyalkanoate synthase
MVEGAEGLDEHTKHKARFYVKQISGALSPSNFLATNPELIRETVKENGANLVRGMTMLAEDIEAGGGELKLRQSDPSRFKVGVNMANTPGKVVFRNDLMELIQYAPVTETVLKRPLLIVPPWINKYYVLDLNPDKSFIRWAVSQGLTVFCISWVNPDERHADKGFEHYMREGIFAALDAIEEATGEKKVTTIGYCVGGTLLAVTLAYMAAKRDTRIESATFFTTQVDFTHAGDLKVFVDEPQIQAVETMMKARGYLDGSRMANAFNMLRPNDLIWPYVVNVYLKGHAPFPFDLLYWNSDSTRMPAANHAFYLRNCYLENNLVKGKMEVAGVRLDLKKVKIPIFNLAAREDHIAPARSVFDGSKAFGGPVDYVLAGSGHIAGVVNPVSKPKYQFWTGGPVTGDLNDWIAKADEHPGTWWPHWFAWVEAQSPKRVRAREPGGGNLEPLCDAPGTYVTAKA